jgi:tryptophan synthase alpha chain
MHAMVDAGADVIELGVPFSDPMADGPVIQKAGERRWRWASARRRCWRWCATSARPTRRTPVVLMGYANPVERYDLRTARALHPRRGRGRRRRRAGRRLPAGGVRGPSPPSCAAGLDLIFLLAPTSTDSACSRSAARRQRLRLLRVAQGRDGRRPPGHRRGRKAAAAHPQHVKCRSASGFGIRDAARRRRSAGGRRRRHRHQGHPGDGGASRATGWCRWPPFLREIRQALDA